MSELTRYNLVYIDDRGNTCDCTSEEECINGEYVRFVDAQSELAAFWEELATQDRVLRASVPDRHKGCTSPVGAVQSYIVDLEQRLADAERRNALLENILKECTDCVRNGEDFDLPITTMARIDAALTKPEEAKS